MALNTYLLNHPGERKKREVNFWVESKKIFYFFIKSKIYFRIWNLKGTIQKQFISFFLPICLKKCLLIIFYVLKVDFYWPFVFSRLGSKKFEKRCEDTSEQNWLDFWVWRYIPKWFSRMRNTFRLSREKWEKRRERERKGGME
jgi:hypothetical protein